MPHTELRTSLETRSALTRSLNTATIAIAVGILSDAQASHPFRDVAPANETAASQQIPIIDPVFSLGRVP